MEVDHNDKDGKGKAWFDQVQLEKAKSLQAITRCKTAVSRLKQTAGAQAEPPLTLMKASMMTAH